MSNYQFIQACTPCRHLCIPNWQSASQLSWAFNTVVYIYAERKFNTQSLTFLTAYCIWYIVSVRARVYVCIFIFPRELRFKRLLSTYYRKTHIILVWGNLLCSKALLITDISQQYENWRIYESHSLRMVANDYRMFIWNNLALVFPCFCLLSSLMNLFVESPWICCAENMGLIFQPLLMWKILVEVIRLCEIITVCGNRGCHIMSDLIWATAFFFPSSYKFHWKIKQNHINDGKVL